VSSAAQSDELVQLTLTTKLSAAKLPDGVHEAVLPETVICSANA
jgi:hypothetical protein